MKRKISSQAGGRSGAGAIGESQNFAGQTSGEMLLQSIPGPGAMAADSSPLAYLLGWGRQIGLGFRYLSSDIKRLLPVLGVSVIWILLLFLGRSNDSSVLRLINFLTFARGGATGGLPGFVGGLLGKGLLVYLMTTLAMSLFAGKKTVTPDAIRALPRFYLVQDLAAASYVAAGVGIALIIYNFLSGDASLQNSMAGITCLLLSLRALMRPMGSLRGLLHSVTSRLRSIENGGDKINNMVAGLTLGFTLSLPLSLITFSYVGYIAGMSVLVLAALIRLFPIGRERTKGVGV